MKRNTVIFPKDVFKELESELYAYDIDDYDVCGKLYESALELIANYQLSIENKNYRIPSATEIGKACFWLLILVNIEKEGNWKLVIRLMLSSTCISLIQILPAVLTLRDDAEIAFEALISKGQAETFEDVF